MYASTCKHNFKIRHSIDNRIINKKYIFECYCKDCLFNKKIVMSDIECAKFDKIEIYKKLEDRLHNIDEDLIREDYIL